MARGLYWTCQYGSNHDPGERCDCRDEKEMAQEQLMKRFSPGKAGQLTMVLEVGNEKVAF